MMRIAHPLEHPTVSDLEAQDDISWFLDHPRRRYRARGADDGNVWLIRRKQHMALLRTCAGAIPHPRDDDAALCEAWVASAHRHLSPPERAELVREIRKAEPQR
jgi:hypothetical protein